MRISHDAIYQALYIQGRGALQRELTACLRTGRALRVPRACTRNRGKKLVTDEMMISRRPAEVEDRAVPGRWEGDRAASCRTVAFPVAGDLAAECFGGTVVDRTHPDDPGALGGVGPASGASRGTAAGQHHAQAGQFALGQRVDPGVDGFVRDRGPARPGASLP